MAWRGCVLALALCGVESARIVRQGHHSSGSTASWRAVLVKGQIDVKRPAFLMLDEGKEQVVISQFGLPTRRSQIIKLNPFAAASAITTVPLSQLSNLKKKGDLSASLFNKPDNVFVSDRKMKWPNILNRLPTEYGDYIVIPDGFLPPLKSDGNIFLANSTGGLFRISPAEKGACYHETEFHDFNGDGLLDILTARFVKSGFPLPKFDGDLLWYENPGVSQITSEWKQHIITQGPDVIFKSIPYEGGLAIFCTEFFSKQLTVKLVSAQGVLKDSRVIDEKVGKPFAVSYEDLDGDGIAELLVTNHQDEKDDIKAGIFAYEIPSDLLKGNFKRHTLAQDVTNLKVTDPGAGSPGIANAFYPQLNMTTGPKHIVAAGDGSFDVWHLAPTSTRFQYEVSIIEFEGTTGQMLLHDFDNDGIMDILVPDNDEWKLQLITFEQV